MIDYTLWYFSSTYNLLKVNKNGTAVFCKFHLKTVQGLHNLTAQQAHQLKADDPDYGTRDLYNAIANGDFPKWDMKIQVLARPFKICLNDFYWPDWIIKNCTAPIKNFNPIYIMRNLSRHK